MKSTTNPVYPKSHMEGHPDGPEGPEVYLEPCTEKSFQANADLKEGVSGRCPIDTIFESTEVERFRTLRSDR